MAALTLDQLETEIAAGRALDQAGQLTLVRRLRAVLAERDGATAARDTASRVGAKRDDESNREFLDRVGALLGPGTR